MTYYRVEFKPLSPYTFGTEQGLEIYGGKKTGKESYIATSDYIPNQTTLLGTLRYLILRKKKLLNTNLNYKDKQSISSSIGPSSFRFIESAEQSFGVINKISPMFLWDGDSILIKNPFCNCDKDKYKPYTMTKETFHTSSGDLYLPTEEDYDAKEGYGSGYIRLKNKRLINDSDIFDKTVIVGNQIVSDANQDDNEAFFKKEKIILKSPYTFSVYLETTEEIFTDNEKCIAYMGRSSAPFEVYFTKCDSQNDINLVDKVNEAFKEFDECWYYALSDIFVDSNDISYKNFCIVEEKYIRNLETIINEDSDYIKKRKKHERVHLISRGSVFYKEPPDFEMNENLKVAGYNVLVKLGGK